MVSRDFSPLTYTTIIREGKDGQLNVVYDCQGFTFSSMADAESFVSTVNNRIIEGKPADLEGLYNNLNETVSDNLIDLGNRLRNEEQIRVVFQDKSGKNHEFRQTSALLNHLSNNQKKNLEIEAEKEEKSKGIFSSIFGTAKKKFEEFGAGDITRDLKKEIKDLHTESKGWVDEMLNSPSIKKLKAEFDEVLEESRKDIEEAKRQAAPTFKTLQKELRENLGKTGIVKSGSHIQWPSKEDRQKWREKNIRKPVWAPKEPSDKVKKCSDFKLSDEPSWGFVPKTEPKVAGGEGIGDVKRNLYLLRSEECRLRTEENRKDIEKVRKRYPEIIKLYEDIFDDIKSEVEKIEGPRPDLDQDKKDELILELIKGSDGSISGKADPVDNTDLPGLQVLTARPVSPGAEKHLGKEYKIGTHGFVKLTNYMGTDQAIADAARQSYQTGTKQVRSERGLIRYLVSHHHTTPLEQVELQFQVRAPIFVARQWFRHRMASYNEESARYSMLRALFYFPEESRICGQDTNNKQASGVQLSEEMRKKAVEAIQTASEDAYEYYQDLLNMGVSRELSRSVLPVNIYTTFVFKMNLKNLCHFINLRKDSHAQPEIREYAEAIYAILCDAFPIAMEAFDDYVFGAKTFSKAEMAALYGLLTKSSEGVDVINHAPNLTKRERAEFITKLYPRHRQ